MSISVSRESISKLMGELVDTFPMEPEGRSSISDFGKLLFTEGQASSGHLHEKSLALKPDLSSQGSTQTGSKRVYTEIKGIPRQKQHDIMKTKDKAVPKRWTPDEDEKLREAVGHHGERNWKSIAEEVPGRNHTQCLQRWTKVLAPGLVKGHWRPDEDELLKELVAEGRKNWGQVATRIPGRTSKQCRERWYNHLDPSIIRGEYTQEEDRMILDAQARLGNRWSAIAAMLPGRTEDAVKIRWKSLCRVRKGQGRRLQTEKGKMTSKSTMEVSGQMMHQGSTGFNDGMVKSEEVAPFTMHAQQHGAPMVRLPNVPMVSATNMQSGGQLGQHHNHHQTMINGSSMMYSTDIRGGGYDPTMAHYRKPPMQQYIVNNGYDHALPSSGSMTSSNAQDCLVEGRPHMDYPVVRRHNMDYPIERRSNLDYPVERQPNMPSDGMPQSQDGYRQGYLSGSSTTYASTMNGGMYSTGSLTPRRGMSNGQLYGNRTLQMDAYRSGALFGTHVPSHQPQQHMSTSSHAQMSYNYEMPSRPSSTEDTNGESSASHSMLSSSNKMNSSVAGFVQRQQEPHQYVDRSPPSHNHHVCAHEQDQSNLKKEPLVSHQAHLKHSGTSGERTKEDSRHGIFSTPSSQQMPNPAALFARSEAAKAFPVAGNGNPVAAFLQMQHHQKRQEEPNCGSMMAHAGPQSSFNPATAFAQRFQAGQKASMPSSNSVGDTKSNDSRADEDDDSESGSGYRTNEPSLKKVKPRLSIDAARASAARRLRNSGSSGSLAGHGSLDVFLNEIGDVGRLSDLKMDEFQTLDELWRVSGDMDRLSL